MTAPWVSFRRLVATLGREPFPFTPRQVAAMTPRQVADLLCERDERGIPVMPDVADPHEPPPESYEDGFKVWCRLNMIPPAVGRRARAAKQG